MKYVIVHTNTLNQAISQLIISIAAFFVLSASAAAFCSSVSSPAKLNSVHK
jgi:hypothetical protein